MSEILTCSIKILKIEFREFCTSLYKNKIQDIFSIAGFNLEDANSSLDDTRRGLVDAFYNSSDWSNEETLRKFFKAIEYTLQVHYLQDEEKNYLRNLCRENGFEVEDNKIIFKDTISSINLFAHQFPAGLPFGIQKPNFSITPSKGSQSLKYELQNGVGLLEGEIYPNFSFKMLEALYGMNKSTNKALKDALVNMNNPNEKKFFLQYARKFKMADNDVPVLIPQAWIQWHSLSKKNLRSVSSTYVDEIYRVDFAAFWNNKRYVILVDDIGHYAVKRDSIWYADEESYSNRLKEDRKLRKEDWQVFRVSNWELRDDQKINAILEDLRDFIIF